MTGTMFLEDGIRRHLPKSFVLPDGFAYPPSPTKFKWFLQDEMPQGTQPLPYPHGVFAILASNPINNVRSRRGLAMLPTAQVDSILFDDAEDTYLVTQEDILDVQSLTGTLAATPSHVFVQGTDYEIQGVDSIHFLAGDRPDDGTNFTVTYRHRLYAREFGADSRLVVRATIKAQQATINDHEYPKTVLARVLGEGLEHALRRNSGSVLIDPNTDEPMSKQAMGGRVLSSRAGFVDDSQSLATWLVEFQVRRSAILQDPPVGAILSVDVGLIADW